MALPKDMRLKGHRTFNYIHKNSEKYYGQLMTFKVARPDPEILLSHKLKNTSKTYCVQNRFFCHIFRFFDLPDVNSGPFGVPKRVPGDDFWVIFEGKTWLRFRNTFFDDFF